MNRRFTPEQLVAHFARLAAGADVPIVPLARAVAANTLRHARQVFGNLDELRPLEPATIAAKARAGYADPEAPLVASGALRDSLEAAVIKTPRAVIAGVGSPDEKMRWHEFGTVRVPARPALAIAAERGRRENAPMIAATARAIATGETARAVATADKIE